jgi:hypothetical protein
VSTSDKKDGMAKRSGKQVFLGVQWDRGSWDNLPPLCDLITETAGKRPLLWNFPAVPPDSLPQARAWLEETVGARLDLDLVAAMGFAGACHPVLTLDELGKELSWGVENPWGTGVAQVLNVHPEILMPRVADTLRADALAAYRSRGFKTLGIPAGRGLSWFAPDGLDCFTYVRVPAANPRGVRRTFLREDVLIMIDLSGSVSRDSLRQALDLVIPSLAPEGAPSPLVVARPSSPQLPGLADIRQDWSAFPAPLLRQALVGAGAGARKKRKRNDEYRELLSCYSLGAADTDPAHKASSQSTLPAGSHLVAQMLGEVSLAGSSFDVRLAGGRFTGIARGGHDFLPLRPARSYLRVSGRHLHFHTRNSFSFEGDGGTGLREVLGIDSPERASLDIEYSFREGSPLLEITAEVRWPAMPPAETVDEHAPFVITLRELGRSEEALITAEAPDGSTASLRAESSAWMVVPAALHRVPLAGGATLLLQPAPAGSRGWSLASFRVAREGRKRFLEANPFGGWFPTPAALLSERRERFSLLIGIEA